MTDKQQEAVKIVLTQCSEGHVSAEEALTIIEAICGSEPQIQYIPYTQPSWPTTPIITYGVSDQPQLFRMTCENCNGYRSPNITNEK